MTAGEIARTSVATVPTDATAADVVETMIDEGVGSVVVTDGDAPVGIVTDRDLVVRVYGDGQALESVAVTSVMSEDLVTARGDEGIYELVRLMAQNGIRRVPLVRNGSLSGIVALDDVIILLSMELGQIGNTIRAESPPFEISPDKYLER